MTNLRCAWCKKFVSPQTPEIYQPPTDSWKLEPEDPEILCRKCFDEAIKPVNEEVATDATE